MKPRAFALLGALVLAAWVALPALAAAPPGKVSVEADGCTFSVRIDLDHAYDLVGWKVKEYDAANWNEGTTLFKGSGPTDGNGDMTVGPFTAPEGHYTVAVDDEYPPDGSSIVIDFWLSCPSSSAGSEAPVDGSTPPSAVPGGGELPIENSAPPSGEVKGIVGTPPVLTPPPTDTGAPAERSAGNGWLALIVALVASALVTLALVPGSLAWVRATVGRRRG